jgi:hypothetical protein
MDPRLHGFEDVVVLGVHCQEYRASPWGAPAYFLGRVKAIQERHRKVEDCDVREKFAGQPDGLMTVGRLGDDFEPLAFQKGSEALSDDYVVVGEEYPGRHVSHLSAEPRP